MTQQKYSPHYTYLKNKWTQKREALQREMFLAHKDAFLWLNNHVRHAAIGSLSAIIIASGQPVHADELTKVPVPKEEVAQDLDPKVFVVRDLFSVVPKEVRSLTLQEEDQVAQLLSTHYGFRVTAQLQGKKLNRSYGLIGAEQHLARFPGDTMVSHFATADESNKYYSSGMAPGLGGFGYFTHSRQEMTQTDVMREKYYIAVQSFLSPGFHEHVKEYIDFLRYRKMLVVNPQNGKAVVAVVADAGPAEWTGKHLGGSPEVMAHLERFDGSQRGPVLYFFIDDPEDKVSLGPIDTIL